MDTPSSFKVLKANKKISDESVCKICNTKFTIGEDIKQCEKCQNYFHDRCWADKGGCNQAGCKEETKACPLCGKEIKKSALKCRYCGEYLDETLRKKLPLMNEDLKHYLLTAPGISRVGLNVLAGIGLFIFGWLIGVVFSKLGKGKTGWTYLIPIIILFAAGRENPELAAVAGLLYLIAWIHANILLSRYQSLANERVAVIDQQGSGIDATLEKGLILNKVLRETTQAVDVLNEALMMQGGDPQLLNGAGVIMFQNSRYREASQFFDRALLAAKDDSLIGIIKKNLAAAQKKLK